MLETGHSSQTKQWCTPSCVLPLCRTTLCSLQQCLIWFEWRLRERIVLPVDLLLLLDLLKNSLNCLTICNTSITIWLVACLCLQTYFCNSTVKEWKTTLSTSVKYNLRGSRLGSRNSWWGWLHMPRVSSINSNISPKEVVISQDTAGKIHHQSYYPFSLTWFVVHGHTNLKLPCEMIIDGTLLASWTIWKVGDGIYHKV